MNILVTGGAGFIGSSLIFDLIEKGHRITCLDNLSSGSKENISVLKKLEEFTFVNWDINREIPDFNEDIDQIYHLASLASPKFYSERPFETAKVNSMGTMNMMKMARENGARILVSSSSEVYGDPKICPQKEADTGTLDPVSKRACYAESKRFAETITSLYHNVENVDVAIARLFNTYGPGMRFDDGRVIPSFICNSLRNDPIHIFGDGFHTRSFCYISDMVEVLQKLMKSSVTGPINLGNPDEEISMNDLAGRIKKLAGSRSDIVYHPGDPDEPARRCPDIGIAMNELGWKPRIDLDEGLSMTISNFGKRMRNCL